MGQAPTSAALARASIPADQSLALPKRDRGRQSAAAEAGYQEQLASFCALIRQIRSSMDFAVGSRGWCYLLERHGLLKGEFDAAQKLITAPTSKPFAARSAAPMPAKLSDRSPLRSI
jgi:hypothetical protein